MADGHLGKVTSENRRQDPRLAKLATKDSQPKKIIFNKEFLNTWGDNSAMYSNPNQYNQGYQNSYSSYQQNYNSGYGYDGYGQQQTYINSNVQPVPPGEEYPQNSWAPATGYNQQHHNNIPQQPLSKYEPKEDEGVAKERKQQHAQLVKQREEYVRKVTVLRRELELLRNQKQDILSENSSQRDMEPILKENDKLQEEIQSKMKAIYNVIEMLSSIIKDGLKVSDLEALLDNSPKNNKNHRADIVHEQSTSSIPSSSSSSSTALSAQIGKYNYMHYDPELHWCRMCDEFPRTAKDLLLHLQCEKHKKNMSDNDVGDNTPWHKLQPEPELPVYENAPKKRIPIRGLQFFISAPAWYCKLCDTWIGDLHCASHHLKSQSHFQNYANFVEQNPHWEIEWLKDREKAMVRKERNLSSDSEVDKKKKRHKSKRFSESSSKDKKRKKRSKKRRKHSSDSSSSSTSTDSSSDDDENNDKSKSIRVVMRNMKVQSIMNEDLSDKWQMLERLVDEHKKKEELNKHQHKSSTSSSSLPSNEDKLINQWMTVKEPEDKILLDNLKDRMKQKQEVEKAKYAEAEKRKREREREEIELKERKEREQRELRERFEREKKERDRQEYERIRDKERESVRFKTKDRDLSSRSSENNESSGGRENGKERSRSRSIDKDDSKKKSAKRLPFIGRMPLFKNKKVEEKPEIKEIKKEDYDLPRRTRFQPGNLPKAFLPSPDVVCYPKLSCIPPLMVPPPPQVSQLEAPEPPKISEDDKLMKPPPAPKIGFEKKSHKNDNNKYNDNDNEKQLQQIQQQQQQQQECNYTDENNYMMNQNMIEQYYQSMDYSMLYNQMYDYDGQPPPPPEDVPYSHTMPLQPPPLPPSDPNEDLAMLGISADDMAAQTFL